MGDMVIWQDVVHCWDTEAEETVQQKELNTT
jgi:hypothetical protein